MRILCAALLALAACHKTGAPTAADGPAAPSKDSAGIGVPFAQVAVKLVDSGSEPRSVLAIHPEPNALQELTLDADYVLTKDGQPQDDYAISLSVAGARRNTSHDEAIGGSHRAFHGTGATHASGFMMVLEDLDLAEPGRACTVRGAVDSAGIPGDVNFACEHTNEARIASLARLAST